MLSSAVPDTSQCDKEPIHLLGCTQTFGCLLALDKDWLFTHASNNSADFLKLQPSDLLGQSASLIFTKEVIHALRGALQNAMITGKNERLFHLALNDDLGFFDLSIHHNGSHTIIECEPSEDAAYFNSIQFMRGFIQHFTRPHSINQLFNETIRKLRAMCNFDRAMVYQFHPDGSGEVVSESVESNLESYLGLRYPASDIPKQARLLYTQNLLRIISDVDATPAEIISINEYQGKPIDLSLSVTRSVSPVHVQYLKNMGVKASLSISILVGGKLWGLLAFHHYTARVLPFKLRTELELVAEVFGLELDRRLKDHRIELIQQARLDHHSIMQRLDDSQSLLENLKAQFPLFQSLIPCDGICVYLKGEITHHGQVLTQAEIQILAHALSQGKSREIVHSDNLRHYHPRLSAIDTPIAGFLAIPLSHQSQDFVFFFRNAITQTVIWAGSPDKAMYSQPGQGLTPRSSFEAWQEKHSDKSAPWERMHLETAESLRVSVLEMFLTSIQRQDEIKQGAQQKQQLLISELNHRVRNILNLVKALLEQSGQFEHGAKDFIEHFTGRISALAYAHDQLTQQHWESVDFTGLINCECEAIEQSKQRVFLQGPDFTILPNAATAFILVFHELITNATKYGALHNEQGHIKITWQYDDNQGIRLNWLEQGGPKVTDFQHQGFGSVIIHQLIPHELGGTVDVLKHQTGLEVLIHIPAKWVRLNEQPHKHTITEQAPATDVTLSGKTCLVVEDNWLIAIDTQRRLRTLGALKVLIAANTKDAFAQLSQHQVDLAFLDINLGDETTIGLAEQLQKRFLPFVFVTGYGEELAMPEVLNQVPVILKPYDDAQIKSAIKKISFE